MKILVTGGAGLIGFNLAEWNSARSFGSFASDRYCAGAAQQALEQQIFKFEDYF